MYLFLELSFNEHCQKLDKQKREMYDNNIRIFYSLSKRGISCQDISWNR